MPSVPIAGSPEHFELASAPSPRAEARRRRFTMVAVAICNWLMRLAIAPALVAFVAKPLHLPFTEHAMIACFALMGLALLVAVLICVGERLGILDKQVLKKKAPATASAALVVPARPSIEADVSGTAENAEASAQTYALPAETHKLTIKNFGTITYRIVADETQAPRK